MIALEGVRKSYRAGRKRNVVISEANAVFASGRSYGRGLDDARHAIERSSGQRTRRRTLTRSMGARAAAEAGPRHLRREVWERVRPIG